MKVVKNRNKEARKNTRFSNKALRVGKIPRRKEAKILEAQQTSTLKAARFLILEDMITTNY